MKTFQIKLSNLGAVFLILMALTVSSCSEVKDKEEQPNEENKDTRKQLLAKIISLENAVDKYKKYSAERIDLLKDTLERRYGAGFEDTRTVWFDIEIIQEYLNYVKEESKKAGITPKGIQFYFGVVSGTDESKRKNHQTFFVAPTKTDNPDSGYTLDANGKPIILKDRLKNNYGNSPNQKREKAGFFTAIRRDGKGVILNDGIPNPPGS